MEPDAIGKQIADRRKARGWTQRELARAADVPSPTISYLERGRRRGAKLTVETLERIAAALQTTLNELTARRDNGGWWPLMGLSAYFSHR